MGEEKEEILTDPVKQIICAKCGKPLDVTGLPAFGKFRCGHCQAVQTVPARLGNFILLELLGRGGMGAVYRAVDQALGRPVAIKVMLRSVAADKAFFEQFKREARAAAALSHPNIVQIFSLDEEKGQYYIVMELLSGGRLDHLIAKKKKMDEGEVLRIALDVAEGLKAAQGVGLIHDDIKPENILFDSKGAAKVVDFGLARFRGKGPQAGQNEIWGTPYYIAPEKVLRKNPDFRSDIYSLGATLFHALTGRPPFEGETAVDVVKARVQGPAPDIRTLRPDLRPAVGALLASMLEREPEKRPATYQALIDELHKLGGVTPPKTGPVPGAEPGQKSTKILIKGKKKALSLGTDSSGDAAGTGEESAPRKKGSGKKVLLVLAVLLVLGLVGWGIFALVGHRSRTRDAGELAARLVRDRARADELAAAVAAAVSPALTEGERAFFYDVEATNHLAKARAILDGMGENAKLVTLPVLPTAGDVARRVEGPMVANFGTMTNLEGMAEEAVRLREGVAKASPGDAVVPEALARLGEIREQATPLARVVTEAQLTAGKVVEEAKALIKQAESTREAGEKAAVQAAEDEAARKKREAEQAEKQRLEAERLAKIKDERDKVAAAWDENADRLRQNRFGEAGEAMKKSLARLATEEGKADAAAVTERAVVLQEMKDYLVSAIQEKPLRWGWFTASGLADVSGASDKGVLVRGKVEPWETVSAAQMLKFLDSYVKSEDAKEKKGKRGWARLLMGASLYCYIQGEKGYPLARTYAEMAIGQDSRLEEEIRRLMPALPKVNP